VKETIREQGDGKGVLETEVRHTHMEFRVRVVSAGKSIGKIDSTVLSESHELFELI
jgi:hypothetical protein